VRSGPYTTARVLTIAVVCVAVAAAALLMFGGLGGDYRVSVTLDNAGQLVGGDQVKVGGVSVGQIDSIELTRDNRATLELSISDDELTPLHQGSVVTVRSTSLAGIANRYVALKPGPNNAQEIPDGGAIPAEDARNEVDLDEVLNTLDPATQRDLQVAVRRSADIFEDPNRPGSDMPARQANAGLEALNPALSQSAATFRELVRDEGNFERFLVKSADVVSAVASRRDDLDQLVGNALGTAGAIARRNADFDNVLRRLPPVLRRTNTTLVNLRGTLSDARPAVREAAPAAPLLSDFLTRLRTVARNGRPVVARLRRTIDRPDSAGDLLGVLRRIVGLARVAVPAFDSSVETTNDSLPLVRDVRPYAPEVVGGLLNGFGGATGGYYDANGHYARISFQSSLYSINSLGSLVPRPPSQQGLTGYRKGVTHRCPGAATQPAPDRSNPFLDGRADFPCSAEDTPR
jgi:phospholipid/cholesterol/gamma-HCH transport system substrate-binding protein